MLKINLIILILAIILPSNIHAKTMAEIISNKNLNDKEIGLAIANEANIRSLGFKDYQVEIEMILTNSYGQVANRYMDYKLLENNISGDKTIIVFNNPIDVKGTALLTFSNIQEAEDQWIYLPALKRVKRILSKNKSGSFMGSEFSFEDISTKDVSKYDYQYLKQRQCHLNDKLLNCVLVRRYPNYDYSGYSHQDVWFDPDFRIIKIEYYDRKNSLHKSLTYENYQKYLGKFWYSGKMTMINHENNKSTILNWKNYKFKTGLTKDMFVKNKLHRLQ